MNIKLIAIGKTDNKNLISLIEDYSKRLSFYIKFEFEIIPDIKNVKNLSEAQQKDWEHTVQQLNDTIERLRGEMTTMETRHSANLYRRMLEDQRRAALQVFVASCVSET